MFADSATDRQTDRGDGDNLMYDLQLYNGVRTGTVAVNICDPFQTNDGAYLFNMQILV
jgi:hypothetical protein